MSWYLCIFYFFYGIDILVNLNPLLREKPTDRSVKNPKRLYFPPKIHSAHVSAIEGLIETLNVYRSKGDYSRPIRPFGQYRAYMLKYYLHSELSKPIVRSGM